MSAEQSDDSESDAPSMASPRLPRADVYAIVAAERDPDISAMDVRHLLEDNYWDVTLEEVRRRRAFP